MFLSTPELLKEVRSILQEGLVQSTTSPLSDAAVLRRMNQAYNEMTIEAFEGGRHELLYFVNATVSSVATGLLDQRIPTRAERLVCVAQSQNNETYPTQEEYNTVLTYRRAGPNARTAPGLRYEIREGDKLYLLNPSSNSNRLLRIWYCAQPPALHYGAAGSGQSTSSTTLTLNNSPTAGPWDPITDIYVGSIVYIYSGTGSGQLARITAVTASTRAATCEKLGGVSGNAFSTAIGTGSFYALQPWFPVAYYRILAERTAAKFGKMEGSQMLESYQRNLRKWQTWCEPTDPSGSMPIAQNNENDMGLNLGGDYQLELD